MMPATLSRPAIDDTATLADMADLILAAPELAPTEAARRLGYEGSAVRRLQRKWKKGRRALLRAAKQRATKLADMEAEVDATRASERAAAAVAARLHRAVREEEWERTKAGVIEEIKRRRVEARAVPSWWHRFRAGLARAWAGRPA